jgi:hypothetical protein
MSSQVFISYPSQSKDVLALLKSYLQANGVNSIWIDKDKIQAGDNISERIKAGVRESACCILLLNKYSLDSAWCMAEVGAFWGANKSIIVYPIEPRCEVPAYLAGISIANNPEDVVKACINIPLLPLDRFLPESFRLSNLTHAFRIPVEDHRREERVKELVANECSKSGQRKFRLLASSGYNYLHPNGKVWQMGLDEAITELKAEFQMVLASPFSQFAITRAIANRVEHNQWEDKAILSRLEELDGYDNVIIRVTEHSVNCSLFFTSDAVFYDPYLWALPKPHGRTENNFWVFEFRKAERKDYDCYSLLEKHFNFLATESTPLKDFLGEGRKRYEDLAQELRRKIRELTKKV